MLIFWRKVHFYNYFFFFFPPWSVIVAVLWGGGMKYLPAHAGSKMPLLLLLLLISLPPSFCRALIIPVLKVHFEIWHLVLIENKRKINLLLKGKVESYFFFFKGHPSLTSPIQWEDRREVAVILKEGTCQQESWKPKNRCTDAVIRAFPLAQRVSPPSLCWQRERFLWERINFASSLKVNSTLTYIWKNWGKREN